MNSTCEVEVEQPCRLGTLQATSAKVAPCLTSTRRDSRPRETDRYRLHRNITNIPLLFRCLLPLGDLTHAKERRGSSINHRRDRVLTAASDWSASGRSKAQGGITYPPASLSRTSRIAPRSTAFVYETWRASIENSQQQPHREVLPRLPSRPRLIKRIAIQRRARGRTEKVVLPIWLPRPVFRLRPQRTTVALYERRSADGYMRRTLQDRRMALVGTMRTNSHDTLIPIKTRKSDEISSGRVAH